MSGENLVDHIMTRPLGTVCADTMSLQVLVDLHPDQYERAPSVSGKLTPPVPDESRAPSIVDHDFMMIE
jgi:hypothetical protein